MQHDAGTTIALGAGMFADAMLFHGTLPDATLPDPSQWSGKAVSAQLGQTVTVERVQRCSICHD